VPNNNPTGINQYTKGGRTATIKVGHVKRALRAVNKSSAATKNQSVIRNSPQGMMDRRAAYDSTTLKVLKHRFKNAKRK
jgi:hypothetical protein